MQLFISTKPCPYQSVPTKVIPRFELLDASGNVLTSLASPSQKSCFSNFLIHYTLYLSTCSWLCFCVFVYFSLATLAVIMDPMSACQRSFQSIHVWSLYFDRIQVGLPWIASL